MEIGDFAQYPNLDYDNEEDTLITAPQNGDHIEKNDKLDDLNTLEKKNPLLIEFESPLGLVERLRKIEAENLDIIQQSQNIVEEINLLDAQKLKIEKDGDKKYHELEENIKKLRETKFDLDKTIKASQDLINRANKFKLQPDNAIKKDSSLEKNEIRPSKSRRDKKNEPTEPQLTVGQHITKIFTESALDEYKKEFKGAGILNQLLAVEKSLMSYIEFKRERDKVKKEWDFNRVSKWPDRSEVKLRENDSKKNQDNNKIDDHYSEPEDYVKKDPRRPTNNKTFIMKKEPPVKIDTRDKEREEYQKYFMDFPN